MFGGSFLRIQLVVILKQAPSTVDFEYKRGGLEKIGVRTINAFIYGCSSLVGLLLCYALYESLAEVGMHEHPDYYYLFYEGEGPSSTSLENISSSAGSMLSFGLGIFTLLVDDLLYFGSRLSHQ